MHPPALPHMLPVHKGKEGDGVCLCRLWTRLFRAGRDTVEKSNDNLSRFEIRTKEKVSLT